MSKNQNEDDIMAKGVVWGKKLEKLIDSIIVKSSKFKQTKMPKFPKAWLEMTNRCYRLNN